MQAGRWQLPPAYLLPSWSPTQLVLLQRTLPASRASPIDSTTAATGRRRDRSHIHRASYSSKAGRIGESARSEAAHGNENSVGSRHARDLHSARRQPAPDAGNGGGDEVFPFPSWRRVVKGPDSLSLHVRLKDWKRDNGDRTHSRAAQESVVESRSTNRTGKRKNAEFVSVRPKGFKKAQEKFWERDQTQSDGKDNRNNGNNNNNAKAAPSGRPGKVVDTTELLRQVPDWTPSQPPEHNGRNRTDSRNAGTDTQRVNATSTSQEDSRVQRLLASALKRGWGAEEDDVELAYLPQNQSSTKSGAAAEQTSQSVDTASETMADHPSSLDSEARSPAEEVDSLLKLTSNPTVDSKRVKVREWWDRRELRNEHEQAGGSRDGRDGSGQGALAATSPGGAPYSRMRQSSARAGDSSYIALDEGDCDKSKKGVVAAWEGRETTSQSPQFSAQRSHQSPSKPSMSLLEELFPDLAALEKARAPPDLDKDIRQVPRLQLNALSDKYKHDPSSDNKPTEDTYEDEDDFPQSQASPETIEKAGRRPQHVTGFRAKDDIAILVLRTADTLLSEADFERVQPRGAHIEEWRGRGSYLKVIPVRNAATLSPIGHYLLMFRSASYRTAYRENAVRLAALASRHVPASLDEASILPYPGMPAGSEPAIYNKSSIPSDPYEDVGSQISEYALTQPISLPRNRSEARSARAQVAGNSNFFWRESDASQSRVVQRLVANRGYEKLAGRAGRAVLFWVDGFAPVDAEIRRVLRADGRDRGIAWSAAQRVERFEISRNVENVEDGPGILGGDVGAWSPSSFSSTSASSGSGNASNSGSSEAESSNDGNGTVEREKESEKDKTKTYSRWILTFDDEAEARRFVRGWHLREWPEERAGGDAEATMHAEFLW